jgi:hypothetical protein
MMVDRDFKVTSINQATKDLLTRRAPEFRKIWPNFNPANIILLTHFLQPLRSST